MRGGKLAAVKGKYSLIKVKKCVSIGMMMDNNIFNILFKHMSLLLEEEGRER